MIVPPQYVDSYNAALIDKVSRLESISEPKIILCGDSNLAFGMDSGMLEEAIEMPVVNMGLHGGLDNKFLERCALLDIDEGDILIVCHSNFADNGELKQPDLAWITLENHNRLWEIPDMQEWMELIPALPNYTFETISLYLSGRGNSNSDVVYAREAFNEYGDNVAQRSQMITSITESDIVVPGISEECVERLNEMYEYCKARGAHMVIAGYPILSNEARPNEQDFVAFQEELEEKMECDVISDYMDYFFPIEYFYDGRLHMTNEGAKYRTAQLIKDIQKWQMETGEE